MRILPHQRESYIPKGALKIVAKKAEAVAYVATMASGKLHAVGFAGKAQKPSFNYSFRTEARCAAYITRFFAAVAARAEGVAKARAERSKPHTLQVGQVLVSSWGYDQTNIDF